MTKDEALVDAFRAHKFTINNIFLNRFVFISQCVSGIVINQFTCTT